MYSAYKLNKQGDNIQPWCTAFPIWNQSVVPCPVLTVASWPAYRFLKRQVRWSGSPISFKIFHSLLWSTQNILNVKYISLHHVVFEMELGSCRLTIWNDKLKDLIQNFPAGFVIQIIVPLAQSSMQNDEDVRKMCDGQTGDTTKYNPKTSMSKQQDVMYIVDYVGPAWRPFTGLGLAHCFGVIRHEHFIFS